MPAYSNLHLVGRTPTQDEYLRLRKICGLSTFSADAARKGLAGTVYAAVIERDGKAIAMGRIIGDGGCFFQVTDIAVDPDYQGRGLGKQIMGALTAFIESRLSPTAYVSLVADVPANKLYEQFGFVETAPASLGMYRFAGKGSG